MPFVLDASVAAQWCFADERTAQGDELLDSLRNDSAVVPGLWHLEVLNLVLMGERRRRIDAERIEQQLATIGALPIVVDPETSARAWVDTLGIARTYRLTSYDAAYLELALRLGLPLATRDEDLMRAAGEAGVTLIPA